MSFWRLLLAELLLLLLLVELLLLLLLVELLCWACICSFIAAR
jgi:hypothetical protein